MELSRWLFAEVLQGHDEHIVCLSGELDLSALDGLESLLAGQRTRTVVLELGGVSFCDVVGISALVRARRELERRRQALLFRSIPQNMWRLADLLGISIFDPPDRPSHRARAGDRSSRRRSRRFSRSVDS